MSRKIISMKVVPSKSGKTFSIETTYDDGQVMSWGKYKTAAVAQRIIDKAKG